MRIFTLDLVLSLPSVLGASARVPAYFHDWDMTLLQSFNFPVHDLNRFFDEIQLFVDLDLFQGIVALSSDKQFFKLLT